MRVLMLTWEYPPHIVGGLGVHAAGLVPALSKLGIEVHVVTPDHGRHRAVDYDEGATVHRIPSPPVESDEFIDHARRVNESLQAAAVSLMREQGPFDLIHNHDWLSSFAARALKARFKVPLLATIHATERGRGRGELASPAAREIDAAERQVTYESWRVICCARFMADEVVNYFGTPRDKIDVVPNGVDADHFLALEGVDLSDFRVQYARPEEKLVLNVGRVVYEKGSSILLAAVPHVLAQAPETKFVIAGKGPELENLRMMLQEMGLGDSVLLAGFIDDDERDRLYKVANCAVFPSLYEPFGIVALEAMAARAPVVVSEVGGLKEVVRHAETGITIYPNSVESCAWGILHTLQHPEWALQRVEQAYHEVLTDYSWASIARQTAVSYQRIIKERALVNW